MFTRDSLEEIENKIYQEWEGNCFFRHGSSNSKGVAVLIKKGTDLKVLACRKDTNGQFIALNISYSDKQIILANIYAPNTDNPGFFINAFSHIDSFGKMDNIIVCGDFNLVLDSSINYENYKDSNHNINSRKLLIKTIIDPQLSGGIEIAQLSHYSRGTTPPLCLPVCRGLRPVSPDDGILVVE